MKSSSSKAICLVLALVGLLLLAGGIYGCWSLAQASRTYEHTTGVIKDVRSERVYRHRKRRTDWKIQINYDAGRYGQLHTTVEHFLPFYSKGDSLQVLYHPERPNDVRLPAQEYWLWGTLLAVGLLSAAGAWLLVRRKAESADTP